MSSLRCRRNEEETSALTFHYPCSRPAISVAIDLLLTVLVYLSTLICLHCKPFSFAFDLEFRVGFISQTFKCFAFHE